MMEIEWNRSPTQTRALELFDRHADRSSHLVSLYPGLTPLETRQFATSYFETRRFRIFANEPICAKNKKIESILNLTAHARDADREVILFPCGLEVAREASAIPGFSSLMIGVEASFNLKNYFDDSIIDPLEAIPVARMWKKRGVKVENVPGAELTAEHRLHIAALTDRWRKQKGGPRLSFLNRVEPLLYAEKKRYFFLRSGEEILAFVALIPVPAQNSYFTSDYIRNPASKAGSMEYLLIETMRILRTEKATEVRMGLCPLARLNENPHFTAADQRFAGMLARVFHGVKSPYPFSSIYEFKLKLDPTRWDPQYLISSRKIGWRTLWNTLTALFDKNPANAFVENKFKSLEAMFAQQMTSGSQFTLAPVRSFSPLKASLGVATLCAVLHALRLNNPAVADFFENYGFRSQNFSWLGWIVGPFFHNTTNHLLGDLASLIFFGYFFEVFFGVRKALPIIALGLWASNPMVIAILAPILSVFHPLAAQHLLSEVDYGSSNAVYALVGAWAATLRRPSIVIIPFLFNGLVVCYMKESIIALHHWVALFTGLFYFKGVLKRSIPPKQFQ